MKNIFCSLSILLLLVCIIYPQELSRLRIDGKGELLTDELIDKNLRDANGEVCAGLMINSDLAGLTYTSNNQIVKINSLPGQDLLFLSPDERVVTVYKTGYAPLKIILNEFGVKLSSGRVWKLALTGDKINDQIPITISTNAEGALITIDGHEKGSGATQWVSIGKHDLIIVKPGFKTVNTRIDVTENNVLFNFSLEKITPLRLTIKTFPKGANIFINGIERGESDQQFFELPGKYSVKLSKPGFLEQTKEIEVSESGTNEFSFQLSKNRGKLILNVDPADASVKLDGEPMSEREKELVPKIYELEVSRSGYFTSNEKVEIKLGETLSKNIQLQKSSVNLTIETDPADASVSINNNNYGSQKTFELSQGNYLVEVKKESYRAQEFYIALELNKPVSKKVKLEPRTGSLQLTVKPIEAGIELYKNGNMVNKWTGANRLSDLLIGEYKIVAKQDNYTSMEKNVLIKEAAEEKVDIQLSEELMGRLDIEATPQNASDAQIYLNGSLKGNAPLSLSLIPGSYNIGARKNGFKDEQRNISLQNNGYEKIVFSLDKISNESSGKSTIMNWVTAGLGIAAGAAAVYYYMDAMDNYQQYKEAYLKETIKSYRTKAETSSTMFTVSVTLGVTSLATSAYLWLSK